MGIYRILGNMVFDILPSVIHGLLCPCAAHGAWDARVTGTDKVQLPPVECAIICLFIGVGLGGFCVFSLYMHFLIEIVLILCGNRHRQYGKKRNTTVYL